MNQLTATITREWLARILSGKKRYEWRSTSDFWQARLEKVGPPPFRLRLINGMKKDAPEATVLVSAVHWDLAEVAFRFTIDRVIEVKNWKDDWTRHHSDGWIEESDRVPVPKSRMRPLVTIPVPASFVRRVDREATCILEIPTFSELSDVLDKKADPPFVVRLQASKEAVDVVVRNVLTPFAYDGPTELVISGRLDATSQKR